MKKILSIISALAVILSIASCGAGNGNNSETTTEATTGASADAGEETTKKGGKVTQVINIGEPEEDTSEEAKQFLKENYPYFYDNFYSIRSGMPLSFVSSTTVGENDAVVTEMYIKDADTMVIVGNDALGRKTRIVYDTDTCYQIYDDKKEMYKSKYGAEFVGNCVESAVLKAQYDTVSSSEYSTMDKEYDGKLYNGFAVSAKKEDTNSTSMVTYYFDKDTNEIKYIISDSSVSEIKLLSNEIADESVFDIPTDYTEDTIENLNEAIMNELTKNQESAE